MSYTDLPNHKTIEATKTALENNNFVVHMADDKHAAKEIVKDLLNEGASVMQMTSVTLDETGLNEHINTSGKYEVVKLRFAEESGLSPKDKKNMGYSADFAVGSLHAITEKGELVIASNSGSQLGGYVYGADKVIFIVGAQKLVKDLDEAMARVYEHVLPLESERAHKAYGVPGSNVSKLLIISREVAQHRVHVVIVNEVLGY